MVCGCCRSTARLRAEYLGELRRLSRGAVVFICPTASWWQLFRKRTPLVRLCIDVVRFSSLERFPHFWPSNYPTIRNPWRLLLELELSRSLHFGDHSLHSVLPCSDLCRDRLASMNRSKRGKLLGPLFGCEKSALADIGINPIIPLANGIVCG